LSRHYSVTIYLVNNVNCGTSELGLVVCPQKGNQDFEGKATLKESDYIGNSVFLYNLSVAGWEKSLGVLIASLLISVGVYFLVVSFENEPPDVA